MYDRRSTVPSRVSRRTALAGLGATGLAAMGMRATNGVVAQAVETVTESGLVYRTVDGFDLVLDVERPIDATAVRPAMLLIHGGSFSYGSRYDVAGFRSSLAKAGYAAYSVQYRLFNPGAGINAWPNALDDVQCAVRWLRAHAEEQMIDPERIGALGHSTGGHLAAFLGTRVTRDNSDPDLAAFASTVNCVVDMAGETDFTIPYENASDTLHYAKLLGGTTDSPPTAAAYLDLSPIKFVDEATAPFLLIHGAIDTFVPVEHSRRMEASLHAAGIETTYAEFPDLGHLETFDWNLTGALILAFLDRQLEVQRE